MLMEEPKFNKGDIVLYSMVPKKEKPVQPVEIANVEFTGERGFVYCINYVSVDIKNNELIGGGGSSGYWDEECFAPIKDSHLKLIAERYKLQRKIDSLKFEQRNCEREMDHLWHALNVINPFPKYESE